MLPVSLSTTLAASSFRLAAACGASLLTCLVAQDSWQGLPTGGGPPPMSEHVAAFDNGRGRLVLLSSIGTGRASTYEFDGSAWTLRTPANAPTARTGASMVYDSTRAKTVLYGGNYTDEHWEYDGNDWSRRTYSLQPEARSGHGMAYDAARGRIVLFGGAPTCLCGVLFDTWEFDGVSWHVRSPATVPLGRRGLMMAYDTLRGRTVMYGGFLATTWFQPPPFLFIDDTWEWDGTDWHMITDTPPPAPRLGGGFTFDPVRGVCVLFGGYCMPTVAGGTAMQDMWEYGANGWRRLSPLMSPAARYGSTLCFDTTNSRLLLHGGANEVELPTVVFGSLHGMQSGPGGTATVYGSGCGVTVPSLTATSLPRVGCNIVLEWAGLPPGAATFLVIGASRTSFAGHSLPLDLGPLGFPMCRLECSIDLVVPFVSAGTTARAVVLTPDAFGYPVYLQSLVLHAPGHSMTPGLALTVGR